MITPEILAIDAAAVAAEIEQAIRHQVLEVLRRKGAVLGISGGVDGPLRVESV